jgi:hypothetical protein
VFVQVSFEKVFVDCMFGDGKWGQVVGFLYDEVGVGWKRGVIL